MRAVEVSGLREIYATGKQAEVQRRVELFVRAAEEALRKDDVIGAANNLRLALENSSDPSLRAKLEAVEGKAKERMYTMCIGRARQAERAERWGEAATYYRKALAARNEAWAADRAAQAMRRDGTDLRQAAQIAERAVLAEPQNAAYRITLGEIYLEAKMYARAAGEATRALALAPNDKRAKALAAAAARARG